MRNVQGSCLRAAGALARGLVSIATLAALTACGGIVTPRPDTQVPSAPTPIPGATATLSPLMTVDTASEEIVELDGSGTLAEAKKLAHGTYRKPFVMPKEV